MTKKIALVGIMGHGKSSVGNLLLGEEKFRESNDIEHCTLEIESQKNDDLEIFDTKGLGDDKKIDANSLQNLINTLKNEKINAIFIVYNGANCRFENSIKNIIKSICKIFMGKYIWKQIGLIFTHYGYDEDTQADVRETGNKIMKKILETAENEYKEIIKNQNQNNKTCDPNEKIVKSLNCFYVTSKKKRDGQYDLHSLEEIKKIKNFVKNLMPIDKVQSKFIVSKKLLKDQKSEISTKLIKGKDKGVLAGLKTFGCYTLGVVNLFNTPTIALLGGASKLISLPFDDDSVLNKFSQNCIDTIKLTPKCFNELPDQVNTKIIGAKSSYILYDLEIFTWSDNTKTYNKINERPQLI